MLSSLRSRFVQVSCPIHSIGIWLDKQNEGEAVFANIGAAAALQQLRLLLQLLEVPDWETYRSHDLRRGHAQDLVESGMFHSR